MKTLILDVSSKTLAYRLVLGTLYDITEWSVDSRGKRLMYVDGSYGRINVDTSYLKSLSLEELTEIYLYLQKF